jgi:hypothetical protein
MLHFVNVLKPVEKPPETGGQKPFFGPEWRPASTEREAWFLDGKWPAEPREPGDETMRFVNLLSPPFL